MPFKNLILDDVRKKHELWLQLFYIDFENQNQLLFSQISFLPKALAT